MADSRPIAVFDSGVGGLSVAAEIMSKLPGEEILYLGDTARVPYGTRSVETIVKYTLECVEFLLRSDPKALVIACNTASSAALDEVRGRCPVPVVDVVGPGARAAAEFSLSGRIGVVATEATVRSGAYRRRILEIRPDAVVVESAGHLLVPIVEEGWPLDGPVVRGALERYIKPLADKAVDAVVLGCTHYPLLKPAFHQAAGPDVFVVDSAEETAKELAHTLRKKGLQRAVTGLPAHSFMVTDDPERFRRIGARFLMKREIDVLKVSLPS